jgi:hypothetical protein
MAWNHQRDLASPVGHSRNVFYIFKKKTMERADATFKYQPIKSALILDRECSRYCIFLFLGLDGLFVATSAHSAGCFGTDVVCLFEGTEIYRRFSLTFLSGGMGGSIHPAFYRLQMQSDSALRFATRGPTALRKELFLLFSRHLHLSAYARLGAVPGYYQPSRQRRDWNISTRCLQSGPVQ